MAKQMTYVDERGVQYTASYWVLTSITIDLINSVAHLNFSGWRDAAACAAGMQPIAAQGMSARNVPATTAASVDAQGNTVVVNIPANPQFDNYFSPAALDAAGAQVSNQGYKFAMEQTALFANATDVA